jgi:carbamoyltransferase
MNILGISAFYHDSAACLVRDGVIIGAAQEERFTRIKHDNSFPQNAVNYCLQEGGIKPSELDYVVFYDKPLLTFDRLIETYLAFVPLGFRSFLKAMPVWLNQKLRLNRHIDQGLGNRYDGPILYALHHLSHAASAFYTSPFEEAAILTVDGVGEWSTTTLCHGRGKDIKILKHIQFPHSLGLLYSAFTYFLGFKVNSGEYKVMGLAPYGEPRFKDVFYDKLIKVKEDGSFWMDMSYFNYCAGLTMTQNKFNRLFGLKPRTPETLLTQKHMDIAASLQAALEDIMLRMAKYAKEITGAKKLCLAGGCALNCVANGKILREGIFDDLFIQPASGDAGGALGAALSVWHQYLGQERIPATGDAQQGSYLGPEFSEQDIKTYLDSVGAKYSRLSDQEIIDRAAEEIKSERVVGFFSGRMEYGPRALGTRSILGDARSPAMQKVLNLKIKFRESFRPFAPIVLEEHISEYFNIDRPSPYMLLVAPVKESIRRQMTQEEEELFGIDKLNIKRSSVPAITHVDYSARIQSVSKKRNGRIYQVTKAFYEKTGCPVIVNTSFNVRGEPIVCSPKDAYTCFMFTHMDVLVLNNLILYKGDQPKMEGAAEHLKKFKLD